MLKTAAKVFGYILLLVGILGFIPGVTNDGLLLGIFQVNALHNIIHIVTGLVGIYAGMQADAKASRTFFQVFGIIYAVVTILGFIYGDSPILGVVASNMADTWLHVVITVFALYMGFAARD